MCLLFGFIELEKLGVAWTDLVQFKSGSLWPQGHGFGYWKQPCASLGKVTFINSSPDPAYAGSSLHRGHPF